MILISGRGPWSGWQGLWLMPFVYLHRTLHLLGFQVHAATSAMGLCSESTVLDFQFRATTSALVLCGVTNSWLPGSSYNVCIGLVVGRECVVSAQSVTDCVHASVYLHNLYILVPHCTSRSCTL